MVPFTSIDTEIITKLTETGIEMVFIIFELNLSEDACRPTWYTNKSNPQKKTYFSNNSTNLSQTFRVGNDTTHPAKYCSLNLKFTFPRKNAVDIQHSQTTKQTLHSFSSTVQMLQ